MGRRAKPPEGKVEAKQLPARKASKKEPVSVHELEPRLAESLEREKATSEIRRVISNSPADVQPVFTALAESAARLCGAADSYIFRVDGEQLRLVARHGLIAALSLGESLPLVRGALVGRSVLERT